MNRSFAGNLETAVQHHRAGRLQQAEAICKRLPHNADALHLRGIIAHQSNRHEEAIELIGKAIDLKPSHIHFHTSLEQVYRSLGRLNEVIASYQRLLERSPDNALAHNNLGNVLNDVGRADEALSHYLRAIEITPSFAEAHANLGLLFARRDKLPEAAEHFERAIKLKPGFAGAHNDLGTVYTRMHKLDEAIASYRKAISLKPDFSEAYHNLGCALRDLAQGEDAVAAYRKAISLNPLLIEAYNDLGNTYADLHRLDEAVDCYQTALQYQPRHAALHMNLGVALQTLGRADDAIARYRTAIELQPDFDVAYQALLLAMQYSAHVTPEEMFAEHVRFGKTFAEPLRSLWAAHGNAREPGKRLKIGYVSPDFRKHSVAYFIEPVLALHDKTQVEVFCYFNHLNADPVTLRLQALADHWVPCKQMTDEQLAERIRGDGIDILVDLAGHTGGNRLLTFARKPAPVQATWLGYPATTGLSAIDYRISDPHAEPVGMTENLNVEQLWRLPDVPFCYRAHDNSPDVIDHPPLLDKGFLTFGCFNNFSKVTDPVLALWAKILQQVPNAKLMLEIAGLDDAAFRAEVETRLTSLDLPLERLLLVPRSPKNQYVLYNELDIVLDPFPCNGGTTSLDTLWMGVPFITLAGRHFTSRMGVTILTNAGLAELIADSEEEYVHKAVALATDLPRLTALRHNLRQHVQQSPLMDAQRFTRNLEQAYRGMWEKWCEHGDAPQSDAAILIKEGHAFFAQGRFDEAIARYRQALALADNDAVTHYNLGVALQHQGKLLEALHCYERALSLQPAFAEAHHNLGLVMANLGELEQAKLFYQQAISLKEDFAEAHNNLGNAFKEQGDFNSAVACYLKALSFKVDFVEVYNNLGLVFTAQEQWSEAADCYQTALTLRPDYAEAHNNFGVLLNKQRKLDDAAASFRAAISLQASYADAHHNLGLTLHEQGRTEEAIVCYIDAITLRPDFADAWDSMLLALQYSGSHTPEDVFTAHVEFGKHFEQQVLAIKPHANVREPGKRLKIGYVSPDFNLHPVSYFMEPVLEQHDKTQVEVYCYYTRDRVDPVTQRLQQFADHWIPCKHLSAEQLADRIRADGIDILVDLAGHTAGNRLLTFARKPAPVQVSYLGYPTTTGLSAVDYRLTDHLVDPAGMNEALNVETLWRLPGIFSCYRPRDNSPEVIDHPPALDNGFVTFGCFNNFSKVTDQVLSLWARILAGVPNARLMLEIAGLEEPVFRSAVEARFVRLGLPLDRILLVPRKPENQYVLYNRIDIALDPFPCNGGTTSYDTLWMGVPFITLAGRQYVARMGVSILSHAGLGELIAKSEDEYVAIATALATDLPRLSAVRKDLRQRIQASPLMDAPRFTRELEQAYREMWTQWCGKLPESEDSVSRPAPVIGHHDTLAVAPPAMQDEVIEAFRQELAKHPDDAGTLNNLGNALKDRGQLDEAATCYRRAIAVMPALAEAHFNLACLLHDQRKLHEAETGFQQAIALKPDFAGAHNNLGIVYFDQGKFDDAIASYRKTLELIPDYATAWSNIGNAQKEQGKLDEALASYRQAIALQPDFAEAHNNMGIAFFLQGKVEDAIACYRQALAYQPDYQNAHNNLGNALIVRGHSEDALAHYLEVVRRAPGSHVAHFNLADGLRQVGRLEEAVSSYLNALALKVDYADAYNNLGITFAALGKFSEAVDCYQTTLALQPDSALAYNNLGNALRDQNKLDEAIACYQKALSLDPHFAEAHNNLGRTYHDLSRPDDAIACFLRGMECKSDYSDLHDNLLFAMLYSAKITPEEMFAAHLRYQQQFETRLRSRWTAHGNSAEPNKRLKIGYVSPDFHRHAVAYFIEPVLALHDKSQVEVFCYYNHPSVDAVTLRLQALAEHWVPCKHLSDDQLAERIRADGIDILIDLAGHTGNNRLLSFARKPAPVQVTWLGYPATTGLSAIDYRISDPHAEPVGMTENLNVEQLWRLPDVPFCYRAHDNSPDVIDHPPLLDKGFLTFGCFNNFSKVTDPVLTLWAKILQQVPNAKLMLEIAGLGDAAFRAEVETRLTSLGLPLERLLLVPRSPKNQYVLYNELDIVLDPFPCNGGTTSLDTLWMGVPFITLAGRHFTSRMGVTILTNAGLAELIAENEEEYVHKAVALATDLPRLTALRHNLRQRVQQSPLMDAQRFTRNLEQAYRGMWEKWCQSNMKEDRAA